MDPRSVVLRDPFVKYSSTLDHPCTVSADVCYHFVTVTLLRLKPCFVYTLSVFVICACHTDLHFSSLSVHTHLYIQHPHNAFKPAAANQHKSTEFTFVDRHLNYHITFPRRFHVVLPLLLHRKSSRRQTRCSNGLCPTLQSLV